MSRGLEVVGTFNVSNKNEVDLIKEKAIELIDLIVEYGNSPRRNEVAINLIEQAQMMGVKSIFSKE
ncbi:MAG: DUF7681 family protein [Bacteroides sp.]